MSAPRVVPDPIVLRAVEYLWLGLVGIVGANVGAWLVTRVWRWWELNR